MGLYLPPFFYRFQSMRYYQVLISAETQENAHKILDALLPEKLVFGGPIWDAPAKFWWKDEIVEMNYAFIYTYTREDLKQRVIEKTNEVTSEDIPMISFTPLDANDALISLLESTFEA